MATSPFAVYYDTEARMYSLVILLSSFGVLAFTAVLRRPTTWNSLALAAVTCGLEYSHYWALYFVAVTAVGTAFFAKSGPYSHACRVALVALAGEKMIFGAWVPTFPSSCTIRAHRGPRLRTSRHSSTPSRSSWAATPTQAGPSPGARLSRPAGDCGQRPGQAPGRARSEDATGESAVWPWCWQGPLVVALAIVGKLTGACSRIVTPQS